jgi:hypothetical protein
LISEVFFQGGTGGGGKELSWPWKLPRVSQRRASGALFSITLSGTKGLTAAAAAAALLLSLPASSILHLFSS